MKRSSLLGALNAAMLLSAAAAAGPQVVRSRTDIEKDVPEPRLLPSGKDAVRRSSTVVQKRGGKSSSSNMRDHARRGHKNNYRKPGGKWC